MPRIPSVTREDLNSDDQAYYDQIVEKRGRAAGPYGVMLHSPKLAGRMGATGSYLRFECEIENTLKEVVIMTTTREARAQYAFTAHESLAREAGVSEATIKIITDGTAPAGLSGDEALLVRYTQELLRNHSVSPSTFDAIRDQFGEQGIIDITGLIGHYLSISQFLNAFEVELPEGVTPVLPV